MADGNFVLSPLENEKISYYDTSDIIVKSIPFVLT